MMQRFILFVGLSVYGANAVFLQREPKSGALIAPEPTQPELTPRQIGDAPLAKPKLPIFLDSGLSQDEQEKEARARLLKVASWIDKVLVHASALELLETWRGGLSDVLGTNTLSPMTAEELAQMEKVLKWTPFLYEGALSYDRTRFDVLPPLERLKGMYATACRGSDWEPEESYLQFAWQPKYSVEGKDRYDIAANKKVVELFVKDYIKMLKDEGKADELVADGKARADLITDADVEKILAGMEAWEDEVMRYLVSFAKGIEKIWDDEGKRGDIPTEVEAATTEDEPATTPEEAATTREEAATTPEEAAPTEDSAAATEDSAAAAEDSAAATEDSVAAAEDKVAAAEDKVAAAEDKVALIEKPSVA